MPATKRYQRHEWDDPDAYGPNGSLKDGHAIRVAVSLADASASDARQQMLDSTYRAGRRLGLPVFADNKPVVDAAGHRPGYRDAPAAGGRRQARDDEPEVAEAELARAEYQEWISNQWRLGNPPLGAVTPDNRVKNDAAMTKDTRELAYHAYDESVSRQWETGKGKPAVRDALPSRGDAKDSRQAAYQAYDESVSQQWRSPTA